MLKLMNFSEEKNIFHENDWVQIRRSLIRKYKNLKLLNTKERVMDFIQASEKTKNNVKVRRKSWEKGQHIWWNMEYQCIVASYPYQVQEKYLDIDGYIYVCKGDDIEATDWEDF